MKIREQIDSILEGRTNIGYGDVVKAQLVSLFEEYAKEKAMEMLDKIDDVIEKAKKKYFPFDTEPIEMVSLQKEINKLSRIQGDK